jgi:phosphoribosyl 1,2-cyclic phosphodiesterase
MKLNILGSGSKGNCYLFNDDLMIDMGLNYKEIKPHMSNVKYLLLTHEHNDHFNITAIRKVFVENDLKIVCPKWLHDKLSGFGFTQDRLLLVEVGKVYTLGDYKISPILLYHDVSNCGYRIMYKGHKHIHSTDTATLEGITAINYDSASIECNHDETAALKLIQQAEEEGVYTHLRGAMNSHLSVQKTIKFIKENNIKKLYPIHIGESTEREVLEVLQSENLI